MSAFLFRCPVTGYNVQGFVADDEGDGGTFHPFSCPASTQTHLVNPKTGKIVGSDEKPVWLPLAHPAAPSHVSALMSGVMTKVAVYGFVRIVFELIGAPAWWWSILVLALGGVTTVMGVLYALMQHDLKRLLATTPSRTSASSSSGSGWRWRSRPTA